MDAKSTNGLMRIDRIGWWNESVANHHWPRWFDTESFGSHIL